MPGTQRLTSYRLPRDLTLGGNAKPEKLKKVYIPNLNLQKNKKKDDTQSVKVDTPKEKDNDHGKGRGRGDNKHRRDKGNIIQSVGIWSQGIYTAPTVKKSYGSGSSGSSSSSTNKTGSKKHLEKSKLNITKPIKNDDEEEKFKNLLSDFDDDTNADKMDPISLPRIIKEEVNEEKIYDEKPIVSENGQVINIKEESFEQNKTEVTLSHIIENKTNPYVLIQFPDCWQDLESNKQDTQPKTPNDSNTYENDKKEKSECCGLNSLKSGLIGKIQILKSGKARLCFGEKIFSININVQQDFQQELLAAKVDTVSLTGDLVNLGPVNNQLLCLPDLETMLKNS